MLCRPAPGGRCGDAHGAGRMRKSAGRDARGLGRARMSIAPPGSRCTTSPRAFCRSLSRSRRAGIRSLPGARVCGWPTSRPPVAGPACVPAIHGSDRTRRNARGRGFNRNHRASLCSASWQRLQAPVCDIRAIRANLYRYKACCRGGLRLNVRGAGPDAIGSAVPPPCTRARTPDMPTVQTTALGAPG
jgi:hypothetical protein